MNKIHIVLFCILFLLHRIVGHFVINIYSTTDESWYYYIYAFVGNPPQKQSLILDSGSSQISFTCKACTNCGVHSYPPFDISKSVTGKMCNGNVFGNERCKYFHRFSEGSVISGRYFSDILSFENSHENPIKQGFKIKYDYFGCNELETKHIFYQHATGVFGIGLKSIADDNINITHFLLKSVGNHLNISDLNNIVISICLLNEGGKIKIGEYNEKIVDNNFIFSKSQLNYIYWVPTVYPTSVYKLKVEGIFIDNQRFNLLNEKTYISAIIDIGSTFSFLPSKLYGRLIAEFYKSCAQLMKHYNGKCTTTNKSICLPVNSNFKSLLPVIQVKFGGQENFINWKHTSYLIKREKTWCIGIKEKASSVNNIILGISFLKNRQLILDPKKKRVGINVNIITKCKD
ncbi:putative AT hook motif-containing protein [Cryptosporidium canis]|uniref:AT hook motif-containing protein n=1 Tax=Cryptosporidium canis TaxID=195482 RepID=A0A9D5HW25_9CRYT|nr:putative AT hook motif-containing protein [Cryptosporidium canis]